MPSSSQHPQLAAPCPGRPHSSARTTPSGNSNYTEFTDKDGKPLPWHHGVKKLPDGTTTTIHVILGVAQLPDGTVGMMALAPYTLLLVKP